MKKRICKTLFISICTIATLSLGGCGKDSTTEATTAVTTAATTTEASTDTATEEQTTEAAKETTEAQTTETVTTTATTEEMVYAGISYEDAFAKVKSIAGSGSNVMTYFKGFDPHGDESWIFTVEKISTSEEAANEIYYVNSNGCNSQSDFDAGEVKTETDDEAYAGLTYEEAVSLARDKAGSGATVLNVIKDKDPNGEDAWLITVMPVVSTASNQSNTYYVSESFCYMEE